METGDQVYPFNIRERHNINGRSASRSLPGKAFSKRQNALDGNEHRKRIDNQMLMCTNQKMS